VHSHCWPGGLPGRRGEMTSHVERGRRPSPGRNSAALLTEDWRAGGRCVRLPARARTCEPRGVTMNWKPDGNDFAEGNSEGKANLRNQDDEFCRRMFAAIHSGSESCPVGVSTEPGTRKPVIIRPDMLGL